MAKQQQKLLPFTPRIIRAKDAHAYLGMDKATFKREIRPYLTVIKLTENKSRGYERTEIDIAFDEFKATRSVAPKKLLAEENVTWQKKRQGSGSTIKANAGLSTKLSMDNAFTNALNMEKMRKQKLRAS